MAVMLSGWKVTAAGRPGGCNMVVDCVTRPGSLRFVEVLGLITAYL